MSPRFDADVLVVGAGPAALTLACVLRRANVSVHVVEGVIETAMRREVPSPLRAEALDVLEDLGVLEEVRAASTPVTHAHIVDRGARQVRFEVGAVDAIDLEPKGLVARTSGLLDALETRLAELDGGVERGADVEQVETLGGAAYALHVDAVGRRTSRRHRYVIDTLGLLRERAGVRLRTTAAASVLAVPLLREMPSGTVSCFLGPGANLGLVLPAPAGDRAVLLARTEGPPSDLAGTLQRIGAEHLRDQVDGSGRRLAVEEGAAERYAAGRLLFLGRASSPMGLPDVHASNLGLPDAADLGWRLARVVHGTSLATLLDGYELERRAIAVGIFEMRARHHRLLAAQAGARFSRRDVLLRALEHAFVRERLARRLAPWQKLMRGPDGAGERLPRVDCRSIPDGEAVPLGSVVSGTHFTLVGVGPVEDAALGACAADARAALQNDVGVVAVVRDGSREASWADWTLADGGGAVARAVGASGPTAVLVRPDGLVAWRGPADPSHVGAKLRATARLAEPLRALRIAQ